jgi:multiple sugar transport system permease protein
LLPGKPCFVDMGKGHGMNKHELNNQRYAMNYIYPALVYLIVTLFFPLGYSLVASFFKWDLIGDTTRKFIGFRNYINLFQNEEALKSFGLTFKFVAGAVSIEMVLGFCIALFLNRKFCGNKIVRVVLLLPMMLSPTIVALMWKLVLNADRGILNYFLSTVFGRGAAQVWLGKDLAMSTLIFVEIWMNTPFVILMVLAGLQSISQDIVDASLVDGATKLQRIFYITIPSIRSVLLVAIIFRTTFALRNFSLPWVLTAGGPGNLTIVFSIELYRQAFSYYHIGYSSALSWILVIVTFVMSIFYTKLTLRKEGNEHGK